MQSVENIMKKLLDTMLPHRAAPELARVLKAHEGPGKTKYSVDLQVITSGTLEDTNQIIKEVPISPIWVAKTKKGVYAIPPVGTIVIVEFLDWNPAYPYVAGIWSDEYDAAKFEIGKLIITDGIDLRIEFSDDEILTHDTNKFEHRFIKGFERITNDKGLNIEIDSEDSIITMDNGKGCSIMLTPDGIKLDGKGSTIVLNSEGIKQNGIKIELN